MIYLILKNYNTDVVFLKSLKNKEANFFFQKINEANTFIKNQQYQLAIRTLKSLEQEEILKEKQQQSIYFLLAYVNKSLGLYHTAINYSKKAIEIKKTSLAYFMLGSIYEKMNRHLEAVKNYEKAIKKDRFYMNAYEQLGNLFFQQGNYQKAFKYFDTASKIFKKELSIGILIKKTACLHLLKKYKESNKIIEKKIIPSKSNYYKDIAHLISAVNFENLNKNHKASSYYNKALSLASLKERQTYSYLQSINLIKLGENEKAIKSIRVNSSFSFENSLKQYTPKQTLGLLYFIEKNYTDSANEFIQLAPVNRESLYYYAVCCYKLKNYQKAITSFKPFILNKDLQDEYTFSAFILSALAYSELGYRGVWPSLLEEAITTWQTREETVLTLGYLTLKYRPKLFPVLVKKHLKNHPNVNIILGSYFKKNKRWQEALDAFIKVIQTSSNNGFLYKQIGDIYNQIKDYKKAISYYKLSLKRDISKDTREKIINNLAYVLAKHQKIDDAYKILLKEDSKAKLSFYLNLSLLSKNKGDVFNYQSYLNKAIDHLDEDKNKNLRSLVLLEAAMSEIKK